MCHGFIIRNVINRNHFYGWVIEQQAKETSADSSETVDGNFSFIHNMFKEKDFKTTLLKNGALQEKEFNHECAF